MEIWRAQWLELGTAGLGGEVIPGEGKIQGKTLAMVGAGRRARGWIQHVLLTGAQDSLSSCWRKKGK